MLRTPLKKLCFLFHKISYKLDGKCSHDVGDQTLAVYVLTCKDIEKGINQEKDGSTYQDEIRSLVGFIDELLSMKEVNILEESKHMENVKHELEMFLVKDHSEILGRPLSWVENVLYLLGFEYQVPKEYSYILEIDGDLHGLLREIEKILRLCYEECNSTWKLHEYFTTKVKSSIPKPLIELQSSVYWSVRHLKYKLFNNPLLTYVTRYPYEEERLNEWFEQRMEDCDLNSEFEELPLRMINVSNEAGTQQVESCLAELKKKHSSGLFFHGTSHYEAMLILTRGVDLSMGSSGQDFSSGDGFYLSDNLQDARQWAAAGRGKKYQAVIVYNLSLAEHAGLDLNGDSDQWQQIVAFCRSQYEDHRQKMHLLKGIKYIKGPACKNPISAIDNKTKFECDSTQQLCIRDKAFANSECNTKNICGVIFY